MKKKRARKAKIKKKTPKSYRRKTCSKKPERERRIKINTSVKITKIRKAFSKKPKIVEVITDPLILAEKAKEKKSTMYFTEETENAIVEYNKSEDRQVREKIYTEKIQVAFEKIAENVFNTFKFSYNEVSPLAVQREAVSHMVMNMEKYNPCKGKAFGYFSIVAKNWFILENNTNYKRFKKHVEIISEPGTTSGEFVVQPEHEKQDHDNREFIKLMVDYWDNHLLSLFPKKRDRDIAGAVIDIFRLSDRIEIFNKKALYLYIRDIAQCQSQHITKVINRMLFTYRNIRREYLDSGAINGDVISRQNCLPLT